MKGFDYSTSSHFGGAIPNLYHYGSLSHIEFNPADDNLYRGYDYGSSSHFEVRVNGNAADFYDYGGSSWTSYSA